MDIPVIYEDESVVVVNKPAGLVIHADGKTLEPRLTDWILNTYPSTKEVGEPLILSSRGGASGDASAPSVTIPRPGIVHRLDRDTSGVLIVAKTQEAFLYLKKQFHERKTKKEYRAFVYGEMKEDSGTIDRPIGRSAKDFRLRSAQRGARGTLRDAVTDFRVYARGKGYTLLSAFPKTGRTHQIRVHLKAINYPVVCDKRYAPKRECALGFTRHALHAYSLELTLQNGERKRFEAPLPQDFLDAEAELRA
jgi:23S rRNA pseudouridine1911/1915/1917 synthase